jgi:hypothetical protein
MTTRTRRVLIATCLTSCAALGGCATQAPTLVSYNTSEPFVQPASLAQLSSLGAGDSLGQEVYRQDVYLAYLDRVQSNTATASVTSDPAGGAGE